MSSRTALALAGEERRITLDALPYDFLQEYREAVPTHSPVLDAVPTPVPQASRLEHIEHEIVKATLEALDGNVSAAARQLGISRNTLYRKLKGP